MFLRVEVAVRHEFVDPQAQMLLRKVEHAHPEIRRLMRWARWVDVYWIEADVSREQMIHLVTEIFWDRVMSWMFTGDLIPSAAGLHGGIQDLLESAPDRLGNFFGLEKRFRPGVTDNVARTITEAFCIIGGEQLKNVKAISGTLLMIEGNKLTEDHLSVIARDVFCNELIESWSMFSFSELKNNSRFHVDLVRQQFPNRTLKASEIVQTYSFTKQTDAELMELSKKKLWAFNLNELKAIQSHFSSPQQTESRKAKGLLDPTDVEIEVLAQTWSEHCKHKILASNIQYEEKGTQKIEGTLDQTIPNQIQSLFKETISKTTQEIPRPWLLSVFKDNAGIVAFDEKDAFCLKVETHNSPSALDPYGGSLTGIVGVNRDIMGCGMGAKPIFNTDVFCVAPPDYSSPIPEKLMHPRRILSGICKGVEHGGNKSGIPTVNGALVFDERYLGKPLVYCGTGGFMPRMIADTPCETKTIYPGDRILMVGGRIGKDGIHGATFSSLALDRHSPVTAVQLGDPITQKRVCDFLLEARDLGLYRCITDNGAGGLSSSVGEMATLCGGAKMDVSNALTKYPGLKPYELVVSESQERMTVAVSPTKKEAFFDLAARRGVEVSDLGEFTQTGMFEIFYKEKQVAYLDLKFLHEGTPQLNIKAVWSGLPQPPVTGNAKYVEEASQKLLALLSRPNIASKEWLIQQYDHEVQGTSVIKPLHTVGLGTPGATSGPNDAGVLKPKPDSNAGITIGCGINPKLSDIDAYLMAQSAVDEAIRNVLAVGSEFGKADSILALTDNFCWPDPEQNEKYAGDLVRACYGMREAALALSAPFISGKDSMKNDYRGKVGNQPVEISVPPTLLVTAVGKISDIKNARTSDFKNATDVIYLLGTGDLGLWGSEYFEYSADHLKKRGGNAKQVILPTSTKQTHARVGRPNWPYARSIYSWIGGSQGKKQNLLRSVHDVSDGGVLVSVAESLIARGLGAELTIPKGMDFWEFSFGEGFHHFVVSVKESDALIIEEEWLEGGVPYFRIGAVTSTGALKVNTSDNLTGVGQQVDSWSVSVKELRKAWKKDGYFQ